MVHSLIQTMKATYRYRVGVGPYPFMRYDTHYMRVEVLGETPKCYRVKYLDCHANGARPGTVTLVRKQNVFGLPKENNRDLDDIKKPYIE